MLEFLQPLTSEAFYVKNFYKYTTPFEGWGVPGASNPLAESKFKNRIHDIFPLVTLQNGKQWEWSWAERQLSWRAPRFDNFILSCKFETSPEISQPRPQGAPSIRAKSL